MEKSAGAHLTRHDIAQLLSSDVEETPVLENKKPELEQHIASCEQCRNALEMHRVEQSRLSGLRSFRISARGKDCPDEAVWMELAADMLKEGERQRFSEHAAYCDYCGGQLQAALRDLTEPPTEEETRLLSNLASATPQWKNDMAAQLAAQKQSAGLRLPGLQILRRRAWMLSAATIVLLLGAAVWWSTRQPYRVPNDLLAQSYEAHRTFEVRFPNAHHAPLELRRGSAAGSVLDRPSQLIEAEATIVRGLNRYPQDPVWNQAKGRADLLEWRYEPAINSFKRAMELQSTPSSELLTDLASAYYERAEATGRDLDYGTAFEMLSRALRIHPDDPVALFNRAVIAEKMKLYDQAITDWDRYLSVESDSSWAAEGRDWRDQLQKKKTLVH